MGTEAKRVLQQRPSAGRPPNLRKGRGRRMQSLNSLTARAVEDPKTLTTLNERDTRRVMARLLEVAGMAHLKWAEKSDREQLAKHRAAGDRVFDTKELCERLGCSYATLMRSWKTGRYPFILKDGDRLVGSEEGLERWVKNWVKNRTSATTTRQFSNI
jgi:hypothetical protein